MNDLTLLGLAVITFFALFGAISWIVQQEDKSNYEQPVIINGRAADELIERNEEDSAKEDMYWQTIGH